MAQSGYMKSTNKITGAEQMLATSDIPSKKAVGPDVARFAYKASAVLFTETLENGPCATWEQSGRATTLLYQPNGPFTRRATTLLYHLCE